MKLGDVITCASCGATATATWSSLERPWQAGWALGLTWTHGPHPRREAAVEAPRLCLWCHERKMALGPDAPPLYRPKSSSAGEGSLNHAAGSEVPPPQPGDVVKGPLDRFEDLAAAFLRETGIWPPGKDRPAAMGSDGIDEGERMERWRAWCAARARPAATPKGTKGQLGLF